MGCTDKTRTNEFDKGDLIAHYEIKSVKNSNESWNKRVWYDPNAFARHTEALPYMSKSASPSFASYDVFGIADQSIYGHLNLKGTFQESGILVRNLFQRKSAESALKLNDVNPRNNDRFLGDDNHANQEIPAEGISENSVYAMGDYLFLAYIKSGDKNRFGYPVKFTFVPEGSVIVDNDQKNAGDVSKVVKTEPAYTYAGKQGEKVPGYFLTAELHNGRSGDSVRWTPNKAGKYKIYVHIPEYGATATEVYYSIKDGSTSILSKPVNQNNNKDKWIQIFDKDGLEDFEFTKDGYLALALDSAASTNLTNQNYLKIAKTQKVAFDAVKFECEAPCTAQANITKSTISSTSIQKGENITFSAVLDKPLSEGYSVRVKYGADLLRMEPDTSAQNFSLTVTPSDAGTYAYSFGIYDDKDVLKGKETTKESFTVTENTASGDYTKIANDGSKLADSANLGANPKDWACTRDNKTGLIWEVKTTDGGLRDMNNYYSWYEPDASKNGGFEGYKNYYPEGCKGSECDTYAFTNAVNTQKLCGANDWRMPNNEELKGLIYCSDNQTKSLGKEESGYICTGSPSRPTINTTYFPDIKENYWFWSSSPYAGYSNDAWVVNFYDGDSYNDYKDYDYYVRLVR